jgi:hypothetical protein
MLSIDEISISNQAENVVNSYVLAGTTFKNNLIIWERETNIILNDIFKIKSDYQGREKPRPTTANEASSKALLTFSPLLKTDSIVLEKDNKIAKVKDDKNGRIVLLG